MKDFVIFSALVGNYDEVYQPKVVDDRFDYILFTNGTNARSLGVWQIRPIPYFNRIQTIIARWVKTHPEALLSEYRASLWIDSNIIITSQYVYDRVIELYQNDILVSSMKHFQRDCVYEELFTILCCGFERESVVLKWGRLLRKNNYPKHNGLCETGVFYRIHSNEKVSLFDNTWWRCIEKFSRRDQFSVNYVLWLLNMNWVFFLPDGKSVYNSDCFSHREHISHGSVPQRIKCDKLGACLIRYCAKCPNKRNKIEQLYYHLYNVPLSSLAAFVLGQLYRFHYLLFKS